MMKIMSLEPWPRENDGMNRGRFFLRNRTMLRVVKYLKEQCEKDRYTFILYRKRDFQLYWKTLTRIIR